MALIPSLLYTFLGGGKRFDNHLLFYCLAIMVGRRSFVVNKLCAHSFGGERMARETRAKICVDSSGVTKCI